MADQHTDLVPSEGDGSRTALQETRPARVRRQHTDPEIAARISEVPPEPRPFSADAPRAGFESGLIFALFALIYGVVGYFTLTEGRIVNFIELNRLNEAYMVLWNDPPRLAAVGLDPGTLISILFIPFSVIKPVATSLVALPVLSALAAGLLMASLNSLMRNCEINLVFRVILLILFGLNPMFVFAAGSGDTTMVGLFLLGVAFSSLISWTSSDQTRHLAAAGLAIGLAVMVDYSFILVGIGFALAFLVISAGKKDDGLKVRSTLLVFLTPMAYSLLFWCLITWVLLGNPIEWITAQNGVIQVNTTGELQNIGTDFWASAGDLFEVTLGIAPLAMLAGIALVVVGILRRDATSWGILLVGLLLALAPILRAVGADQADLFTLEYGLPLAVFALAAVAWCGRDGWGMVASVVIAVGLIAAIPLGWNAMQDYSYQNQAQAFTRFLDTRESQEGTESVGGYQVGIDPELAMAKYINESIPQEKRSILVDENFSYGVMITSGRPQNFADRADDGESSWQSLIDDPFGEVNYMLITTSREGDQIAKKWPEAVTGGVAGLDPVFRTDRYVLIQVAETAPAESDGTDGSPANRSEPNPITPSSPLNPDGPGLTTPSGSDFGGAGSANGSGAQGTGGTSVPPSNNGSSSNPILEGE